MAPDYFSSLFEIRDYQYIVRLKLWCRLPCGEEVSQTSCYSTLLYYNPELLGCWGKEMAATTHFLHNSRSSAILSNFSFAQELLKQKTFLNNCLLSRNEQDTNHNLHMWNGCLAGNLILLSIILLCLSTCCAQAALYTLAQFSPVHSFTLSTHVWGGRPLFLVLFWKLSMSFA